MALTNYVAATPLMIVAGLVLDWRHSDSWAQVFYRHGPLEHLWRWATWLERPRLRRGPLRSWSALLPRESLR